MAEGLVSWVVAVGLGLGFCSSQHPPPLTTSGDEDWNGV